MGPIRKLFLSRPARPRGTTKNRPRKKITRATREPLLESMNPDESPCARACTKKRSRAQPQKSRPEIRAIVNSNINERVPAAVASARASAGYRARGVPRVIDTPASDASLLFINMPINLNVVVFDLSPSRPPNHFLLLPILPRLPATRLINFVRDVSLQMYTFHNLIALSGAICALSIIRPCVRV